jgi:CheY-like chemotaxis protein
VPCYVRGDPVRLRQVVLNLIGNAMKFTSSGEVVVRVTPVEAGEKSLRLRFEVTDTGIGIPALVQERLFQPFVQADSSTTRKFGGTGLGLAISKRLVELMHGTIGVTSAPGEGSSFWFTAQLAFAAELPPKETSGTRSLFNRRVLVVDDNATNLKLLSRMLTTWQMPHTTVESAEAALAALRGATEPFGLVLLDRHMPKVNGLQLAAMIRAEGKFSDLPLVLLTTRGERMNTAEREAHGLAACEFKPVHPVKLRTALLRVLAATRRAEKTGGTRPPLPMPRQKLRDHPPILVAEDNIVNQKVTLLQLRGLGYNADVVANGREVLAALRARHYALILMDAQMPEMDGIEATGRIRAAQAAKEPGFSEDLRIIAMTANAMTGDREACIAAGMDDYLSKPVKAADLDSMLTRYLGLDELASASAAKPAAAVNASAPAIPQATSAAS